MTEINWREFEEVFFTAKELAKNKSHDYGTQSLIAFGSMGCVIRLYDKVNRLKNLTTNQYETMAVKDESIEDTCLDIINYAIYTILLNKKILIQKK